jgi:hypothetical protein
LNRKKEDKMGNSNNNNKSNNNTSNSSGNSASTYVNKAGTHIKVSEFKNGKGAKIDFYDKNPSNPNHKSVHVKVNTDNKTFTTVDNVSGTKQTSSGSCFLTTACMRYFQKAFDDNCHELIILRWFRDNFVSREDVEHYYKSAPAIVTAIENSPNNDIVYNYIYDNIVDVCVDAIKSGEYELAYDIYKNSVLNLEKNFV